MPRTLYQKLLDDKTITADPIQARVVDTLQTLHDEIVAHPPRPKSFWNRFSSPHQIKGLYLYGGVGRGKSMLMDLFFDALPEHFKKRRIHFHEFMIEVHDYLHKQRGDKVDQIIPKFASYVAESTYVLCFDEFQVTDVADAMILGRLFQALFEEGIVIITTSNRPPDELYKGGLQRDRFEPFVKFIKTNMTIMHLDSETDYRRQDVQDNENTKYFTPLGEAAKNWANHIFLKRAEGIPVKHETLRVKGRDIHVEAAGNVARFTFSELCERPYGAEDFLTIARCYPVILLENIPVMNYDRRNEAKRLMTLIDTLYDEDTDLYITAAVAPDKLYRGEDHKFEFDRTVSRLIEMGN